MLSRRKTGKTVFMHRLYNILFHQNDREGGIGGIGIVVTS